MQLCSASLFEERAKHMFMLLCGDLLATTPPVPDGGASCMCAGRGAQFAFPETRLGIIPGAGGTQRLPRVVGRTRAKDLIFTGRGVDSHEALKIGASQLSRYLLYRGSGGPEDLPME